ncbi:MAG: SPW repeat protein, partial [Actinomycetota bacterium]|nr:SPW repeat protein [Actinomycetota bacterium]
MLRQGPIPRFVHGLVEYLAAALLIAAPFLLGFSDVGSATAASIVAGVVVLFIAATTQGATSLIDQIPLAAHVALDYLLAALLIAAPFLFGFSEEDRPLAFFLALGVVHLLLTIGTRFEADGERPRRRAAAAAAPAGAD